MPAATRKRLRYIPGEAGTTDASTRRCALAARVEPLSPHFWHHAASSHGVSGADAFLVHLGQSIAASLLSVAESSETARAQLREARTTLHAAIDARCDELGVSIASSEATKTAALERELVAADAALEKWRAVSTSVCEAVLSLTDADLEEQHASLSSRLDDMEAQLQALPTAVVEPPLVGLLADEPALLSSIAGFGRVLAPLPITADDFIVKGVPSCVRRGNTLYLCLALGARHAAQSAEELEVSLGRLVKDTRVESTLEGPGVEQTLLASLAPHALRRCLRISLDVPSGASRDARVKMSVVSVAGKSVSGLPLSVPAYRGVLPPLVLQCTSAPSDYTTPCISPEGRVYCPPGDGPEVLVFDADGSPLPGITVASLELASYKSCWSAYAHWNIPSLLLAGNIDDRTSSRLVTVDLVTQTVRWTADFRRCSGIATLPALGIVVISDDRSLFAHRLSDGVRVGSLALSDGGIVRFLAAVARGYPTSSSARLGHRSCTCFLCLALLTCTLTGSRAWR